MNKHHRDCVRLCREAGLHPFETENRGKHWAVVCIEGRVFCPCTPSDHRWRKKLYSVARKLGTMS